MIGNFQAATDTINDNAARIELLEQGSGVGTSMEEIIAGSNYKLLSTPVVFGAGTVGNTSFSNWIEHFTVNEEFTFHEDGIVSYSGITSIYTLNGKDVPDGE